MSIQRVGDVVLAEGIVLRPVAVSAGDLTGEGVFVLDAAMGVDSKAPLLILDEGLALSGISVRDAGADVTSEQEGRFITVACAGPSGASLINEDPGVSDLFDRFRLVPSGAASVGVDERRVQLFHDGSRWLMPDWDPEPAQPAQSTAVTANPSRDDLDPSWVVIPEMSVAFTPARTWAIASFDGSFLLDPPVGAACVGQVRIEVDDAPVATSTRTLRFQAGNIMNLVPGDVIVPLSMPYVILSGLTPGVAVTVTAKWSVTSETIIARDLERSLIVRNP